MPVFSCRVCLLPLVGRSFHPPPELVGEEYPPQLGVVVVQFEVHPVVLRCHERAHGYQQPFQLIAFRLQVEPCAGAHQFEVVVHLKDVPLGCPAVHQVGQVALVVLDIIRTELLHRFLPSD